MKLGLKIIFPIAGLLFLLILTFFYILYRFQIEEGAISENAKRIKAFSSLNEQLNRQHDLSDAATFSYLIQKDKSLIEQITQSELEKSRILDEMSPFVTTPRGRELAGKYIEKKLAGEQVRDNLLTAVATGDQNQIQIAFNRWSIQSGQKKAALADLNAYNINSIEKTLAAVEEFRGQISQIVIILIGVMSALIILFYFYLRQIITNPIIALSKAAQLLSHADFTTTTTTTTSSKDEIGQLARAFDEMRDKLSQSYQGLEEKVKERNIELQKSTEELEKTNKFMVGRELKMVELKKEIADLKNGKAAYVKTTAS